MNAPFWYKIAGSCALVVLLGYGGYRGFVAFQSYETNQINAAVQLKTSQLEQSFSFMEAATSSMNASTSATTTINNRVAQLEAQIQQLQTTPSVGTAQVAALQKQVVAIKNASSGPIITYVNPTIMISGYANTISINGTGFESGATVKLGDTGLHINGNITSRIISAAYPAGFNPGTYDVTVINPDGGQFTYPSAITIESGSSPTTALTTAQIVTAVSPSVVLIRTNLGCGTGMVVKQGGVEMILTNYHVISGNTYNITVYTSDGASWSATPVGTVPSDDLALLSINDTSLPAVVFGDSSNAGLPLGSNVVALGYPITCNTDQTLDVEPGYVTARRTDPALIYQGELIQTSASIQHGDSGGPLVNSNGEVIGIDNGIDPIDDMNLAGIAYAIPISVEVNDFGSNGAAFLSGGTSGAAAQQNSFSPTPTNSQSTMNVTVTVNNSQGGTAKPSDFTVTIVASNPSASSFPGSASGTQIFIDMGKLYGVNISLLPSYTELTNGQCANKDGLVKGQIGNCVITEEFVNSSGQN